MDQRYCTELPEEPGSHQVAVIDSHCHIDQYPDPESIAAGCEKDEILTIAVTSLPSHYETALSHLHNYRFVRPALGFYPLLVAKNGNEISAFESLSKTCRLIGQVGLDGKNRGLAQLISKGKFLNGQLPQSHVRGDLSRCIPEAQSNRFCNA